MARGEEVSGRTARQSSKQVGHNLRALRKLTHKNDRLLAKTTFALEELYAANDVLKNTLDRLAITLPEKLEKSDSSKSARTETA